MSYEAFVEEDARLTILKELARQTDGRLNETLITHVLNAFGHNRSRDWVRTQLNKMAELGAVTITEVGTVMIASITRAGLDHVQRRSVISGIARPSPEV